MAEHLQTMRNKHAITLEHLRIGAPGIILDADGSVNPFDQFEITQKVFEFSTTTATKVKESRLELWAYLGKNLNGERMTGVHRLCSSGTSPFDEFTGHDEVNGSLPELAGMGAVRSDMRSGFSFAASPSRNTPGFHKADGIAGRALH